MRKRSAVLLTWACLVAGGPGALQEAQHDTPPPATAPALAPASPTPEMVGALAGRLSAGAKPKNLIALLRSVNRFLWKEAKLDKSYRRGHCFPAHPLGIAEDSPPVARALAARGFFAEPVKLRLLVDRAYVEGELVVVEGRVRWRQHRREEYLTAEDRIQLSRLRRAVAVLRAEIHELKKDAQKSATPSEPREDELDREIRELLRELIAQVGGDAADEDRETVLAIRADELEEAQRRIATIYEAAHERKEYAENAYVTAYIDPRSDGGRDASQFPAGERVRLYGMVSHGAIGEPFLMTDKPFLQRVVMVARAAERPARAQP